MLLVASVLEWIIASLVLGVLGLGILASRSAKKREETGGSSGDGGVAHLAGSGDSSKDCDSSSDASAIGDCSGDSGGGDGGGGGD